MYEEGGKLWEDEAVQICASLRNASRIRLRSGVVDDWLMVEAKACTRVSN